MLKKVSLKFKLLIAFMAVGLIPFAIIGAISLIESGQALSEQSWGQLVNVREIKKSQIESFFKERQGDMGVLVETAGVLREGALNKLKAIEVLKKSQLQDYINSMKAQLHVIKGDATIKTAMVELDRAFEAGGDKIDTPEWKKLAEGFDIRMKDIVKDNGWYDLFLIHKDGDVVYTVAREPDLGMIIPDSELKDSPLGQAYAKAKDMSPDEIAASDLGPYSPSGGRPAAFMMAQLRDDKNELLGYVAFQIPFDKINSIMQVREGMGQTGETYLVGQDGLMRSDSYLDKEGHSVVASFKNRTKVQTKAVEQALAGNDGHEVIIDYNGNPVISVWSTVDLGSGVKWAIISEVDVAEAFSPKDESGQDFYGQYVKMYGYYDLFLFTPDGYCFYSVAKESDYRTNLVSGKYRDSNLGGLVRSVIETKKFGLADFKPYAPSNGEPASFIAQPLLTGDRVEIVVAVQLSIEAINHIMQQREGMGRTGETYLVGPGKLMRSDSFLDPVNRTVKASFANPEKGLVDTRASREALAGKTGAEIIEDYNGNSVLSAFTPVKAGDATWALLAEIDEAEAFAAVKTLKQVLGGVVILGLLGIVVLALMVTRSITGPIKKIVQFADLIRRGDLSERNRLDRGDEIGTLAAAFDSMADGLEGKADLARQIADGNLTCRVDLASDKDSLGLTLRAMVGNLNEVLSMISEAAAQVAGGAGQVSDSSQSLSQGASEQAASLEEITSSMTEISTQIKINAENATQANLLATTARDAAEKGNVRMRSMVAAMTEINSSSKKIAKIIKTIDDIAFQTNLLALNAAVEAARAGRHGQGFAVVAQEVRNLAGRSAKAARETAELIEGSMKTVENGSTIVNTTAEALTEIVSGVTKVSDLVAEIAAANNEQAQGIAQVNLGLGQIEQVTQQNTANAEETAAAAEQLSSQATLLRDALTRFKLKKNGLGAEKQYDPGVIRTRSELLTYQG